MKILVNALSGIGDALMFTPALKILKEIIPNSIIDILVMYSAVRDLFENNPAVHQVYFVDFFKQSKFKSLKDVKKLRKNKYDFSVNVYPSNRLEYNFLNFLLGAKKRISFKYVYSGFFRMEYLNNIIIPEEKNIHNVIQNIKILDVFDKNHGKEAGPMQIFIPDEFMNKAKKWMSENNLSENILIGVHAGSSTLKNHINKRWNVDKYVLLLEKLMKNYNAKILLFGSELDVNSYLQNKLGSDSVQASTDNFLDSAARLGFCKLFVTNDTAFLHSASAMEVPVVAIFGYTNAKELYPWKTRNVVVRKELDCSPCFYNSPKPARCLWKDENEFKCIKSIEVDEVYKACTELLDKKPNL